MKIRGFTGSLLSGILDEKAPEQKELVKVEKKEEKPSQSTEVVPEPKSLADFVTLESGGKIKPKEEKKTQGQKQDDVIDEKDFNPDVVPAGSKAITAKFKRFSAAIDASKAEVSELKKQLEAKPVGVSNVAESPEFKALQKQHDDLLVIVEQTQLASSPRFHEEYEKPRQELFKIAGTYIARVTDASKRRDLVAKLDQYRSQVNPGEENDPIFYEMIDRAISDAGITGTNSVRLIDSLQKERDLTNKQHAALSNWQKTKVDISSYEDQTRAKIATVAESTFDGLVQQVEAANPGRAVFLEKTGLLDSFNEMVVAKRQEIKKEISKSAKAGVISGELLTLIHMGHELPFHMKVAEELKGLIKQQAKELREANDKIAILKGASPNNIRKESERTGDNSDGEPKSLIEFVRQASGR